MKQLLFLCLLSPLLSLSQVDSSKIAQSITLSQLQHTYLVGFLTDFSSSDRINYVYQVRSQYDTADMAQPLSVTVPSTLVLQVYSIMTQKPEGQTAEYNNAIRDSLLPQLTNPWLLTRLAEITARNIANRQERIRQAQEFIMNISRE